MKDANSLREKFLDFFEKRDHTIVPSSSLIPDDPSVLLTTAGMQQFKPYYTGEADPLKTIHPNLNKPLGRKNAASIQKSFRTSDIDEVGDERHLTFFEMAGNFSFGGYFKKEAIQYAYDFIAKELKLPISYVSIFKGSESVPKDEQSLKIWQSLGITNIKEEGMEDVFWGPTGSSGPCGPTTEIYCRNSAGQDIEVWNIVFNEFYFPGSREELMASAEGKSLQPLATPGIDTGMGLERLAMIAQRTSTIFETDLFNFIFKTLPAHLPTRIKRIFADHIRGAVFLIADGVSPSNKEAGYILRRILRRSLSYCHLHGISNDTLKDVISQIIKNYSEFYPELLEHSLLIQEEIFAEKERFAKTLSRGIRELRKVYQQEKLDAKKAFNIYETFGLPFEIIKEVAGKSAAGISAAAFAEEFRKHRKISRAGAEKKFGGHGLTLDTGEIKARNRQEIERVTRLHTATHLLQAALRDIFGSSIRQEGSDINAQRLRFDFPFPRKMSKEELKKIEQWVNEAISKNAKVKCEQMPYKEAVASGALHFFRQKYPPEVTVYTIKDEKSGKVISKELCGGPHVKSTKEIGRFIILKEESSAAGIRRIRATVEP